MAKRAERLKMTAAAHAAHAEGRRPCESRMAHVQGVKRHQKLRAFLEKCHLMLLPKRAGSVPSIEDCSKLEVTDGFMGCSIRYLLTTCPGVGSNCCHGTRTSVLCCGPEAVVEVN